MSKVLPILFNTEMVQAILDGRKTVTRRLVRRDTDMILNSPYHKKHPEVDDKTIVEKICTKPCQPGDILYVRETFDYLEGWKIGDPGIDGKYFYRADGDLRPVSWRGKWHPSLHMPKEAARIWLKVKNVRVERLQDITEEQAEEEGFDSKCPYEHRTWIGSPYDGGYESMCWAEGECHNPERWCDKSVPELFGIKVWNSTIKKSDLDRYGWDANPLVWVIEFERCEKPWNL